METRGKNNERKHGQRGVRAGGTRLLCVGVVAHLDRVPADFTGIAKDSSTPTGVFPRGSVFHVVDEDEEDRSCYIYC